MTDMQRIDQILLTLYEYRLDAKGNPDLENQLKEAYDMIKDYKKIKAIIDLTDK